MQLPYAPGTDTTLYPILKMVGGGLGGTRSELVLTRPFSRLVLLRVWFDLIWFDLIWFDLIWFDLIWFDLKEEHDAFLKMETKLEKIVGIFPDIELVDIKIELNGKFVFKTLKKECLHEKERL